MMLQEDINLNQFLTNPFSKWMLCLLIMKLEIVLTLKGKERVLIFEMQKWI